MKYEARFTELVVMQEGKEIFDDTATTIRIEDEGGGEFVTIGQPGNNDRPLRIDPTEWPYVRAAINEMIKKCKELKE